MVSIVICARNLNEPKIKKCLKSIEAQTYKDIEVIIETEGSLVEARKRGIEKAKGEYICLVDSDQVLPLNLIISCILFCEEPNGAFLDLDMLICNEGFDAVTWFERAIKTDTFCEKVIDYDKKLFHEFYDDDLIRGAAIPRFFKSEYLKRIDWSRLPPITFEHTFIHKQVLDMGAKICWINEIVLHHEPETFRELFKKFFRYGYYYFPALKFDKQLVINHSYPRRVYFSLQAWKSPLLYLGLWYHYFIKAIAATLGGIWYGIKYSIRNNSSL